MSADSTFQRLWYEGKPAWLLVLLLPLSLLYRFCIFVRRTLYRTGLLPSVAVSRPVIVVGNVTVGGTGKTPLVIWLTGWLQKQGLRVAVVLRGYGGRSPVWPREVTAESDYREVGDEAVLIAGATQAIVVVAPDRVAAAQRAVQLGAQVVLADDGMQHYRLRRDAEIAVVDEQRAFGNRLLLPAGPLREPWTRLRSVDLVVRTCRAATQVAALPLQVPQISITSRLGRAVSVRGGAERTLESFKSATVHAIAGIGNPEGFFAALEAAGLQVLRHPMPDHADLAREDIDFGDGLPVLMTAKDAVKCRTIADDRHWMVTQELQVADTGLSSLDAILGRILGSGAAKQ